MPQQTLKLNIYLVHSAVTRYFFEHGDPDKRDVYVANFDGSYEDPYSSIITCRGTPPERVSRKEMIHILEDALGTHKVQAINDKYTNQMLHCWFIQDDLPLRLRFNQNESFQVPPELFREFHKTVEVPVFVQGSPIVEEPETPDNALTTLNSAPDDSHDHLRTPSPRTPPLSGALALPPPPTPQNTPPIPADAFSPISEMESEIEAESAGLPDDTPRPRFRMRRANEGSRVPTGNPVSDTPKRKIPRGTRENNRSTWMINKIHKLLSDLSQNGNIQPPNEYTAKHIFTAMITRMKEKTFQAVREGKDPFITSNVSFTEELYKYLNEVYFEGRQNPYNLRQMQNFFVDSQRKLIDGINDIFSRTYLNGWERELDSQIAREMMTIAELERTGHVVIRPDQAATSPASELSPASSTASVMIEDGSTPASQPRSLGPIDMETDQTLDLLGQTIAEVFNRVMTPARNISQEALREEFIRQLDQIQEMELDMVDFAENHQGSSVINIINNMLSDSRRALIESERYVDIPDRTSIVESYSPSPVSPSGEARVASPKPAAKRAPVEPQLSTQLPYEMPISQEDLTQPVNRNLEQQFELTNIGAGSSTSSVEVAPIPMNQESTEQVITGASIHHYRGYGNKWTKDEWFGKEMLVDRIKAQVSLDSRFRKLGRDTYDRPFIDKVFKETNQNIKYMRPQQHLVYGR